MKTIKVIDDAPGSGKTSLAINMMNNDNKTNYIYVTPFLDEIERVRKAVTNRVFHEPANLGFGKLDSLKNLLLNGKSITTTHALFKFADDDIIELIKINNYVLILDEVMQVLEYLDITKDDIKILVDNGYIKINEEDNTVVRIHDKEYTGKFSSVLAMVETGRLLYDSDLFLLWCFPVNLFEVFSDVYVMTYMFDGSLMSPYFKLFGVDCEFYSIENSKIIPYRKPDISKYEDLINILEDHAINNIGNDRTALSFSWYSKKSPVIIAQLRKNLLNYYKNITKAKSKDFLWTTFKEYKPKLSGNGFRGKSTFCPHSMRATNDYIEKSVLAYTVNRFINPFLVSYFKKNGITIDEDIYSTSEMLQWIFRAAVRDDKPVTLYIPSKRMRELLFKWLNN